MALQIIKAPDNTELGYRLRYIATLNPRGVNVLATSFGYHVPKNNVESRIGFLNKFMLENEEQSVNALINIHPDRQLFQPSNDFELEDVELERDNFIGGIITAAGNLGAAGINKIGAGKERATAERIAGEGTTQAKLLADSKVKTQALQTKQTKLAEQSKEKQLYIVGGVAVGVIILIIVGIIVYKKYSK